MSTAPHITSFLDPHPAHPNLPSFPTRRSSDLDAYGYSMSGGRASAATHMASFPTDIKNAADAWKVSSYQTDGVDARSEEHTSELQSRFDLVCRLLLEKKKKKIKI